MPRNHGSLPGVLHFSTALTRASLLDRRLQEFIEILKLHEDHRREEVEEAIGQALEQQCLGYQPIRHLIRLRQSPVLETQPLAAELIPGITDRQVSQSEVTAFNGLLGDQS